MKNDQYDKIKTVFEEKINNKSKIDTIFIERVNKIAYFTRISSIIKSIVNEKKIILVSVYLKAKYY